jgi:UPF0755 protein
MRWFIGFVTVLLLVGLAAVGAVQLYNAPGPLVRPATLVVPHGSLDELADALVHAGVIRGPLSFKAAALATSMQGRLHAAELVFPSGASLATVLDVLRFGHAVQHHVTIPEGLTASQISDVLARADGLTGDLAVPPEGSVLPDTYAYTRGTTRAAVLARAESAMTRLLASAWAGRAPNVQLSSPRDALILASIVEREAKLPVERPMIARVFLNRLAHGMRLQADPTSLYGASGGTDVLDRPLSHDDLARIDPYNTYVVDGLPAGPICSPGAAAITAVLHPAAGDALYFVADGTGGHLFAATLASHNTNVARLRHSPR